MDKKEKTENKDTKKVEKSFTERLIEMRLKGSSQKKYLLAKEK